MNYAFYKNKMQKLAISRILVFVLLLNTLLASCTKDTEMDLCKRPMAEQARLSWIDDDFNIYAKDGTYDIYIKVHDWCIDNGIRFDFAYIPYDDGTTPNNTPRLQLAKKWESEGFGLLYHPAHLGWYDSKYEEDYKYNFSSMAKKLQDCIRYFDTNNIKVPYRVLVYPGSSGNNAEVRNYVRQYVDLAICATESETNHRAEHDQFSLKRYAIEPTKSKSKTQIKKDIKRLLDNGDWVILYTHLYNFTDNGSTDEHAGSIDNLFEILTYANSLCPIRLTQDVWDTRKSLWGK